MAKRKAAKEKKGRNRLSLFSLGISAFCILFLCGFLLSSSSYSKTEESSEKPAKKSHAENKGKKAAVKMTEKQNSEELPVSEKYSYDSTGKPDPFLPLVTEAAPQKLATPQEKAEPLTPLQKYDLSELNLVAIIALGNRSSALLEDSAGFGYIVNEGMLIGKNDGIIKKITINEVIIEEKVYDSMGNTETEVSTLTIQHQE